MAKLTLSDIANAGTSSTVYTINANNAAIEAAMENTLSRDGSTPNTMGANLDMNSYRIVNVSSPSNAQDAATKKYVDDAAFSGLGEADLDMRSYRIINVSDPLNAQDVATKKYVDDTVNNVDSDIDMNSYRIINTSDPLNDQDVATKKYVDDAVSNAETDLDMNSYRIINVSDPLSDQDVATKKYVDDAASSAYSPTTFATKLDVEAANIPLSFSFINTTGYSTSGDGGGGLYVRSASEPTHAGKIQSADGAWWELTDSAPNPRQFGAVGDGVTDDISAFNEALTTGSVYVPEGFYRVSGSIGINNTSMPGETESGPGGRTIVGQDARLSVVRSLVGASGPVVGITYGTGAQSHSYHRFEKLSIIGRNNINGMDITNAAFLRLSDLTLRGCSTGLRLRSVLSSTVRDCRFDGNATGVEANKSTGFSFTNAVKFDGCVFSNNTAIGLAIGDGAHNVQVIGGSVEGNGTQGDTGTGGIFLGFNGGEEGAVGALIEGVYFENNAGAADIRLENIGTDYVTVIIRGCNFNRISSTNFVTNNITAIGNINLVLIGNAFKAFGTYVENAGRQYVNRGAGVRLTSIGNMFKSTVAATGMNSRGNLEKARGSVSSAGSALSLPEGWSVANTSTGVYRVTHNMGLDPSLYSVVASSTDTVSNQVQRVVKGALGNSFDVVLSTSGGTLINAPFDFVVFVG